MTLYSEMMAARAHATERGNTIARQGCVEGACIAATDGDGCDAVELWLDWTNRYDGLRDAWHAAGRPE